jgi:phosphopantetheine adenylyltransferase
MSRTGILGGTFDVLQDGHQALLSTASSYRSHITVGLTLDEFAQDSGSRNVSELEKGRIYWRIPVKPIVTYTTRHTKRIDSASY